MATWCDDFIFMAYELAQEGKSDKEIATELGLTKKQFTEYKRTKPGFKNAIEKGKTRIKALARGFNLTANQRKWLSAYAETGSKTKACEAAFLTYGCHQQWLKQSEERGTDYKEAWQLAQDIASDRLETEARRRGVEGVRRHKFFKGRPIMVPCEPHEDQARQVYIGEDPETEEPMYEWMKPYVEHEYSDQLLVTLLKANLPDKYADRSKVEHQGGATILHDLLDRVEAENKEGKTEPDIVDGEFVVHAATKFIEEKGLANDGSLQAEGETAVQRNKQSQTAKKGRKSRTRKKRVGAVGNR